MKLKLLRFKQSIKIFTDLKFAILVLSILALFSSLGSFIEQDESLIFYQENYPSINNQSEEHIATLYGFLNWNFIKNVGLDHVYTTWWFFSLLLVLGICLVSCTITRQFPIFLISKDFLFKKQKNSFLELPFFVKIKNISYLKEMLLVKIHNLNFYIYQRENLIYGYKGLIGRISPILVHLSLILILGGSSIGAFKNFKAQEVLPKGEISHVQNPLKVGFFTSLPDFAIRVNDFWVEYEDNRIHQFYSNLSLLDNFGQELKQQTISVNNPLRYSNIDLYQSDWNLLGIRLENTSSQKIYELPLFSLKKDAKSWITWIKTDSNENFALIFDQLENVFFLYDDKGSFKSVYNLTQIISANLKLVEILPSTGLLIKYDPSIFIIYLGFGLLMITTILSYLPYTQIWIFNRFHTSWLGSNTNRGKIELEITFENLVRFSENMIFNKILRNI